MTRCSLALRLSTIVSAVIFSAPVNLGAQVSRPTVAGAAAPSACCEVVAIDAKTGLATAKIGTTGNVFNFKPGNPATLVALRVGQAVFANLANHQVSLDGRSLCCMMLGDPHPAVAAIVPGGRPLTNDVRPDASRPAAPLAGVAVARTELSLPTIAFGAPQPMPAGRRPLELAEPRQVTVGLPGHTVTGKVVRLRGIAGIESASGIPDGARRLLAIHVRTLDPGQPHDYIVNTELAEQWIQSHPVAADIKASDAGHSRQSCSGADYLTKANCDYQAVGDGWSAIQDQAKKDWNHASDELTHDWNMAQGCFADRTLPLSNIPVQFSITPNITIPLSSVANGAGVANSFNNATSSGKVDGSVGLGFPMQSDFLADLDLFYIPCLPFVVRPKAIAAKGTMTVGETLTANVSAEGKFDRTFKIPPTGGPKIPIQMIPIIIGGVPVAELDVSAYIEGNVEVGGNGKADGHFALSNPHKATFAFSCNGGGCGSAAQQIPDPTQVSESAEIKGQVFVKPSVYTALQLDFDYDLLSARAGPQPYLLGMASGCAEASAQQASTGQSTSEENHALTADLDWGVDLRAEALVAGQVVGKPYVHSVTGDKHLWFRDLAPGGSTALVANVQGAGPATVAKPASYKVKMPACYPYTNRIQYMVMWTGQATPARNSACQWQAGRGTCQFDPTKELSFDLTWPAAGTYSLTVSPVSDEHHRTFNPAPPVTRMSVTVGAGG